MSGPVQWETGERLHRDLHPVDVLLPDGEMIRRARVFATSHRVLAFVEGPGRTIELAFCEPVEPGSVPACRGTLAGGSVELRLAQGTGWVNPSGGCGCGSALLALAPPIGWDGTR